MTGVPALLIRRLDELGAVLAGRGDAIALIGVGSVGRDLDRLDEHSDLDFFAVVEPEAKQRYLDDIDWLEAVAPVAYSFENTVDGRKVLFDDDVYAEYAVFTLEELRAAAYSPGRVVWRREDAPPDLSELGSEPGPSPHDSPEFQVNEALTNVYVGLHRDARGERLSAARLIQVHAVDRVLRLLELTGQTERPRQDAFAIERGAEARIPPDVLSLAAMMPGYERNGDAARAVLEWLEASADVDPALAAAVRRLLPPPA